MDYFMLHEVSHSFLLQTNLLKRAITFETLLNHVNINSKDNFFSLTET